MTDPEEIGTFTSVAVCLGSFLFFHTAVCAGATQMELTGRIETVFADFLLPCRENALEWRLLWKICQKKLRDFIKTICFVR